MDIISLPALAVMITLRGLPGFGLHRPGAHHPVASDSLPPAWRTSSRLALENDFVTARLPDIVRDRLGARLVADPRTLRISVDPDSGMLSVGALVNSVPVGPPLRQSLDSYADNLSRRNFERIWTNRSIESSTPARPPPRPRPDLSPGEDCRSSCPRRCPGGCRACSVPAAPPSTWPGRKHPAGRAEQLDEPADRSAGTEALAVPLARHAAGPQHPARGPAFRSNQGQPPSEFGHPGAPGQSHLHQLQGRRGRSGQALDLGNTSLSLPGTQYVSYSGKNEGLFGVKTALRLGPADFTALASKQEGRSERASYTGGASRDLRSLADLDYIKGVYFLLFDPNVRPSWLDPAIVARPDFGGIDIPDNSIQLYLDDANYNNDVNFIRGKA